MSCFLFCDDCKEIINMDHIVSMDIDPLNNVRNHNQMITITDTRGSRHTLFLPGCKNIKEVMLDLATVPKDQGYVCVHRSKESNSGYVVSTFVSN